MMCLVCWECGKALMVYQDEDRWREVEKYGYAHVAAVHPDWPTNANDAFDTMGVGYLADIAASALNLQAAAR